MISDEEMMERPILQQDAWGDLTPRYGHIPTAKKMDRDTADIVGAIAARLAQMGMTDKEVALALGTSPKNLQKRFDRFPRMEKCFTIGRSKCTRNIIRKLYETALGGQIIQQVTEYRTKSGILKGQTIVKTELAPNVKAMLAWLAAIDPKYWRPAISEQPSSATVNIGIINPQMIAEDIERIKRLAGSLVEHRPDTITVESSGETALPTDSDKPQG